MKPYHKIQTVFLRNPEDKHKTLLMGEWARPEFQYLLHNEWYFTEKIDGTNIRIMFDGENIEFGGRTDKAEIPKELLEYLEEQFLPLKPIFQVKYPSGICLYGEGYGGKIQKVGKLYSETEKFILFDALLNNMWFERSELMDVAETFGLDIVPIIGTGTIWNAFDVVRDTERSFLGNLRPEGIVARPKRELINRMGQRIITKLKYKDLG
jgi:hypothetical protein